MAITQPLWSSWNTFGMRTPGKLCTVGGSWQEATRRHVRLPIWLTCRHISKQHLAGIAGRHAESEAAPLKPCRQEADELDAEGEAALAQLRQAARQLLGMVSLTSGPAAAARLADVSMSC
jgi:hypothetical protein